MKFLPDQIFIIKLVWRSAVGIMQENNVLTCGPGSPATPGVPISPEPPRTPFVPRIPCGPADPWIKNSEIMLELCVKFSW